MPDEQDPHDVEALVDLRRADRGAVVGGGPAVELAWSMRLDGHDLQAIGNRLGKSRERARQLTRQALWRVERAILQRGTEHDAEACGWVKVPCYGLNGGYFWSLP
jgi:hypothetical protein